MNITILNEVVLQNDSTYICTAQWPVSSKCFDVYKNDVNQILIIALTLCQVSTLSSNRVDESESNSQEWTFVPFSVIVMLL